MKHVKNLLVNKIYNMEIIKYKKDDNLYCTLEQIIDYYKTNNKVKIEDGEGDWDNGKWKVTADVELTLKSEDSDTPATE